MSPGKRESTNGTRYDMEVGVKDEKYLNLKDTNLNVSNQSLFDFIIFAEYF